MSDIATPHEMAPSPVLRPRRSSSRLTRLRQSIAHRLYGAANAMEGLGWRVDKQEWTGAGSGEPERRDSTAPGRGLPLAAIIGAGIIGGAAIVAGVGWRLMPRGQHQADD